MRAPTTPLLDALCQAETARSLCSVGAACGALRVWLGRVVDGYPRGLHDSARCGRRRNAVEADAHANSRASRSVAQRPREREQFVAGLRRSRFACSENELPALL